MATRLRLRVLVRGAPVEGARVVLLKLGELDSSPGSPLPRLCEALTSGEGLAELVVLPGEYAVSFTVRKVFRAVLDSEEVEAVLLEVASMGEGYSRLRINLDPKNRVFWVRVWFVKPLRETPEEYRKRWEEFVRRLEERGEEWDDDVPCWIEAEVKAKGYAEVRLPRAVYRVEVSREGYESAIFRVYLFDSVEEYLMLFKGGGATYYGTVYPERRRSAGG